MAFSLVCTFPDTQAKNYFPPNSRLMGKSNLTVPIYIEREIIFVFFIDNQNGFSGPGNLK